MGGRSTRGRGILRTTACAAAVVCAVAVATVAPQPASAAAGCADEVSGGVLGIGGGSDFYDDPKASDAYDDRFSASHDIPRDELRTHVPQGMATWSDWRGGQDLLLVSAYQASDERRTHIIALDADSGGYVGTVEVDSFHAGGIAVFEEQGFAYLPDAEGSGKKVGVYSLTSLRQALLESTPDRPGRAGPAIPDQRVSATSFLTSHGPTDTLWAGRFDKREPGAMRSYTVAPDGSLSERGRPVQVPPRTQGVVVTDDLFVYSTSFGRDKFSEIHVVQRGEGSSRLDTARTHCFRAPSMAEGMAVHDGDVHITYESGASTFHTDGKGDPLNSIENLHRAPLNDLARAPG